MNSLWRKSRLPDLKTSFPRKLALFRHSRLSLFNRNIGSVFGISNLIMILMITYGTNLKLLSNMYTLMP